MEGKREMSKQSKFLSYRSYSIDNFQCGRPNKQKHCLDWLKLFLRENLLLRHVDSNKPKVNFGKQKAVFVT